MPKPSVPLIEPYGGTLVNLLVDSPKGITLKQASVDLPSVVLTDRQLCDLELLATGAFSPLKGFMNQADYTSVLKTMRLADGTLFPVPITLAVDSIHRKGEMVALRDSYGNVLAIMTVEDVYDWDKDEFAKRVLGRNDPAHNLVRELAGWGAHNISGRLQVLALPPHKDFKNLRLTPREVRQVLTKRGNANVVAFQTRNPINRATEEMTKRAAVSVNGTLLLHPVVGMTKPGDVDHVTRVRCYKALADNHYDGYDMLLSLLPLAMRMAGPREAVWHAIIRRNFGANYFISGRDHAGPGNASDGTPFYGQYEAQDLARSFEKELGMTILSFHDMLYLPQEDRYAESNTVPEGVEFAAISGTQIREEYLAKGRPLPAWYARPEVAAILSDANPPRLKQGFCLWFTGLSGAGKSTVAGAVEAAIAEYGRRITMLDGDIVRQNLSKGLGFSREDRETNIKRVGFVASRVTYHHGVAICALISPYEKTREEVRSLFQHQNFIEIYISTPLEICEQRDPKGHYDRSRQGKMPNFTGIDDSYEPPLHPEITIDTSNSPVEDSVNQIIRFLKRMSFIASA
jgi:sulfate adenylyltransferase